MNSGGISSSANGFSERTIAELIDLAGGLGYIGVSGGLTINVDAKRIYVVRANGAVQIGKRSR